MKKLKFKDEIQNIIGDWLCKQGLSIEDDKCEILDKTIMKAINKKVKSLDVGEMFGNFIWSDDKKDIGDLIIHIKKNIIKEMK